MVSIRSHSSVWGHGSEFIEYDITGTTQTGSMIAGIHLTHYASGVIVWLRGGRTYYYDANHSTQILEASSGNGEIVVFESPPHNVREAFQTKSEVDSDFELVGRTSSGNIKIKGKLTVADNVGIGTTTPEQRLQVVGGRFQVNTDAPWDNFQIYTDGHCSYLEANGDEGGLWIRSNTGQKVIIPDANVGIGTTSPSHKLSVNGTIKAKEIIVETSGWADHVFADDYALAPLSEVEAHIKANKHLPGVPSAAQVSEQGISVGDMQARLLAKIEELTLHQIEQEKRLAAQESRIQALESENRRLQGLLQ